ncbi:MAG: hypothetical protein NTX50_29720 [Candidatus Sumerlaeota bacterium]|nr:hypothetical protein [Candidatus Sumerlaeota bacterium]
MSAIPIILVAVLALLLFAGGAYSQTKSREIQSVTTSTITVGQVSSLSKQKIEDMLGNLEKKEAPAPKMGAMCYTPSPPLQRAEYICPVCGEKTIYAADKARLVAKELKGCRLDADVIKKASKGAITLDESSLCKKCSPSATTHDLTLKVTYADGAKRTVTPVDFRDLRLVRDFLNGKSSFTTSNDGELPLKSQSSRLRQLLGLSLTEQTQPANQEKNQKQEK